MKILRTSLYFSLFRSKKQIPVLPAHRFLCQTLETRCPPPFLRVGEVLAVLSPVPRLPPPFYLTPFHLAESRVPVEALPAPRRKRRDSVILVTSAGPRQGCELAEPNASPRREISSPGMEATTLCPTFAPAASAQRLRPGCPGANARKEPTARGSRHCRGHGVGNQDGAQPAETLAAPASRGDGADPRANTHREKRGDVWVGGRGARRVTRPPYLQQLFAPRLSQSLQDAKVQGKPARRRPGRDGGGEFSPFPLRDCWAGV